MKLFLFLLLSASFSINAIAQQDELLKKKLWDEYKNNRLLIDPPKGFKPRANITIPHLVPKLEVAPQTENKMMVLKVPLKRTYSGNNGMGSDIYTMQPDNMPCLVPDKTFSSNMPVAKFEPTPDVKLKPYTSPNKAAEKPGDGLKRKNVD